jgi:integrase
MKTLADVIAEIRATDQPARKKQEIISAFNTAARALGKPLDRIPVDPARLMAQLQQVAPQPLRISRRRWANVMSHIRAGLALLSPVAPCRSWQRLSEQWEPLYRQLDRWGKLKLSRFLRFLSAQGIEPDTVTETSFTAFREHLDSALLWNLDKIYVAAIDGWRKAEAAVQGWPTVEITRPNRRRDWTFDWPKLPPCLRQEFDAWCKRSTDPIEEVPLRPVKVKTIAARDWQVRAFATALVLRRRDPPDSLRDLVQMEAFKEGLRYLAERYGGITKTVYGVAVILKTLARHHRGMDQSHLDGMARVIKRLNVGNRGMTEKNQARLRQFSDPQKLDSLVLLPETLMALAARNPKPHKAAIQAQTAVAIEILLVTLFRIGNLAQLDLEKNFVALGRDQEVLIVIPGDAVKNGKPIERPLPRQTVQIIDRYLTTFWPRLAAHDCTALFPGRKGGSKSLNALRDQISKTIRRYVGAEVHPHLFRHLGAKNHLEECPGEYETVRLSLGHASSATTTKSYTGLETVAAFRHYDETILKLRERAKANEQNPSPRSRATLQATPRVARPRPGIVGGRPGSGRPVRERRR